MWDSLAGIIDDLSTAASMLGRFLPQVIGCFMSLIVAKTLAGLPMVLLRVSKLAKFGLLRCALCEKKLAQRKLDQACHSLLIFAAVSILLQIASSSSLSNDNSDANNGNNQITAATNRQEFTQRDHY